MRRRSWRKPLQREHRGSENPRGRKGFDLFTDQNVCGKRSVRKVERRTKMESLRDTLHRIVEVKVKVQF